jgi:hypothetical protein
MIEFMGGQMYSFGIVCVVVWIYSIYYIYYDPYTNTLPDEIDVNLKNFFFGLLCLVLAPFIAFSSIIIKLGYIIKK